MREFRYGLLIAVAVACGACGDDDVIITDTGSTDAGTDAGGDTANACGSLTIAASVGEECGGLARCADGAECSQLSANDASALCRQTCIPDACESVCADDEVCFALVASPGTGVCGTRPTGTVLPYAACSGEERCADPAQCIVAVSGASSGVCLPPCDAGACAPVDGRDGQCVVSLRDNPDTMLCAPACSAAGADEECLGGMTCQASGAGFVCAFPQ
ncbi:MAG: hypothetical protein H6698_02100 [Myxococcales bacterium]|nr:hypothetical protein [Myxococcales bacterium]MCB9533104.1 hypothetical protein [Myxococcales bacterium]